MVNMFMRLELQRQSDSQMSGTDHCIFRQHVIAMLQLNYSVTVVKQYLLLIVTTNMLFRTTVLVTNTT